MFVYMYMYMCACIIMIHCSKKHIEFRPSGNRCIRDSYPTHTLMRTPIRCSDHACVAGVLAHVHMW